jgi:hypothetical protein
MPFFHDPEGRLHARRTFVFIAALVLLMGLATVLLLVASTAISIEVLAIGVIVILIVVKLPLLAFVWWLLGRHQEKPGQTSWSHEERSEILAYLEGEAAQSVSRPDAKARLRFLAREAWHVADTAPDEDKASAVAVALRISQLEPVRSRPAPPAAD